MEITAIAAAAAESSRERIME
jgi:hypothetical protein